MHISHRKPTTKTWKEIGLGLVGAKPDPYQSERELLELTQKGLNLKARVMEVLAPV